MSKKEKDTNDLHEVFKLLAQKLTFEEYKLITGTIFQLHCGVTFGYKKTFDAQLLPDISAFWEHYHKKKIDEKNKILKLKVIKGGKTLA